MKENVLHKGVRFEDYLTSPGINASGLKHILRSPAHYQASLSEPPKATVALEFGKLLHFIILEPEEFHRRAYPQPKLNKATKKGKVAHAAWVEAMPPGAIVVPDCWEEPLRRMHDKVYAHPAARRLLEKGIREGTFWWKDPKTGLLCKGRPDFVSATGIVVDLKSVADARKDAFSRDVWKYRYDVQAAHYCAGAEVTGIARHDSYAFLCIEKEPPYEMAIYTCGMPDQDEERTSPSWSVLGCGSQWRDEAMRVYKQCRETQTWPGYQKRPETIELPRWAKGVGEDDE